MTGRYKAYPEYKESDVQWLGDIPADWNVIPLKHLAALTPKKSGLDKKKMSEHCSFIPMDKLKLNQLKLDETKLISDVYDGYTYFENEDVLIAKVTPCFENKNMAVAKNLLNGIGFGSSEIYVLRANSKLNNQFLFYRLQEDSFMEIATAAMSGAGGLKRVPAEVINTFLAAFPSYTEQQKIANFLDHETDKIDTLITKQEKLIELLKEKRQAVISHAVTKGLNPDAPMKDSGVEWLGEVPEHWGVGALKHIVKQTKNSMVDGPFGSSVNTEQDYVDDGIPVIRTVNIANHGFAFNNLMFMREEKFQELQRHSVHPNDVLFSKVGTIGNACILPKEVPEAILSTTGSCKITVENTRYLPEYLVWVIQSMNQQLMLIANSNVQPFLNMSNIKNLVIPMPSISEQKQVIEVVTSRVTTLDYAISKSEQLSNNLKERKTALISATVTGKIDVRAWKPQTEVVSEE